MAWIHSLSYYAMSTVSVIQKCAYSVLTWVKFKNQYTGGTIFAHQTQQDLPVRYLDPPHRVSLRLSCPQFPSSADSQRVTFQSIVRQAVHFTSRMCVCVWNTPYPAFPAHATSNFVYLVRGPRELDMTGIFPFQHQNGKRHFTKTKWGDNCVCFF